MKIGTPEHVTRTLGEAQGYNPLPVFDTLLPIEFTDGRKDALPVMFTVWHPSPEELAALNAGGHIVLGVLGTAHPAVLMQVANNRGVVVEEGVKQ